MRGRRNVDGTLRLSRVEREVGEAAICKRKEVKAVEKVVLVVLEEESKKFEFFVPRQ